MAQLGDEAQPVCVTAWGRRCSPRRRRTRNRRCSKSTPASFSAARMQPCNWFGTATAPRPCGFAGRCPWACPASVFPWAAFGALAWTSPRTPLFRDQRVGRAGFDVQQGQVQKAQARERLVVKSKKKNPSHAFSGRTWPPSPRPRQQPHPLASRQMPLDELPAQRRPVYFSLKKTLHRPVAPAFFRPARQAQHRDAPRHRQHGLNDEGQLPQGGRGVKCGPSALRIAMISAMVRSGVGCRML